MSAKKNATLPLKEKMAFNTNNPNKILGMAKHNPKKDYIWITHKQPQKDHSCNLKRIIHG